MDHAVKRWLPVAFALLVLSGCATREFYLQRSELPLEACGISQLRLARFQSGTDVPHLRFRVERQVRDELTRVGLLTENSNAGPSLTGALDVVEDTFIPATPRRVERGIASAQALPTLSGSTMTWEVDVQCTVRLRIVLTLLDAEGRPLWQKRSEGSVRESRALPVQWPGADLLPPPLAALPRFDAPWRARLEDAALAQALGPLLTALVDRYAYREIP